MKIETETLTVSWMVDRRGRCVRRRDFLLFGERKSLLMH